MGQRQAASIRVGKQARVQGRRRGSKSGFRLKYKAGGRQDWVSKRNRITTGKQARMRTLSSVSRGKTRLCNEASCVCVRVGHLSYTADPIRISIQRIRSDILAIHL